MNINSNNLTVVQFLSKVMGKGLLGDNFEFLIDSLFLEEDLSTELANLFNEVSEEEADYGDVPESVPEDPTHQLCRPLYHL
jgi:hypothetical protein